MSNETESFDREADILAENYGIEQGGQFTPLDYAHAIRDLLQGSAEPVAWMQSNHLKQVPEDAVKIPTSVDEAELMARLGLFYIQQKDPVRFASLFAAAQGKKHEQ